MALTDIAITDQKRTTVPDRPTPLFGGRRATRYRVPTVLPLPPRREAYPVPFTHDDLDRIEARFDAEAPGSCWCGYGTWQDAQPSRVVLYRVGESGLRLTLTRLSDGTYDLASDSGATILESVSLDRAIDRVVA